MRFEHLVQLHFGAPNDEALSGHRLHRRGLEPYRASEVLDSDWIDELERANRVHPQHQPAPYRTLRHVIIVLHDSTFECVVSGWEVETVRAPLRATVQRIVSGLR